MARPIGQHLFRVAAAIVLMNDARAPVFAAGRHDASLNSDTVIGAQTTPIAPQQPVRTPLEVPFNLNGRFLGTISVDVDRQGEGAADALRLLDLLKFIADKTLIANVEGRVAGRKKVDFADLSSADFQLKFDSLQLSLEGHVPVSRTNATSIAVSSRDAPPIPSQYFQQSNLSAGVNVSISQRYSERRGEGFDRVTAAFGGIANIGGFEGVTLTAGADYNGAERERPWRRREVRLTKDFYDTALRATLGELTSPIISFQGSGRLLGASIGSAYSTIRPFQNIRPGGRRNFTLERDSLVDVYINDLLSQSLRLGAGRYNIADFPFAGGANRVRLEVQDTSGRREIASFDVFSDATLLDAGISDFTLSVGVREADRSLTYGRSPAFSGYYQRGLTSTTTAGLSAQATTLATQVSALGVWGTRLGLFQLQGAFSRNGSHGKIGSALALDYRGNFSLLRPGDLQINFAGEMRSALFQDAFVPERFNLQRWQLSSQILWLSPLQISVNLGLNYARSRDRIRPNSSRVDLSLGRSFGRVSLNGSISRQRVSAERTDWRVAIGATLRLGNRLFVGARVDSRAKQKEVDITRPASGELDDISGAVRLIDDDFGRSAFGQATYVNNRFVGEIQHNRLQSRSNLTRSVAESVWRLSSFIGIAGGSVGIGRPITDGFVVAPTHTSLRRSRVEMVSGDRVLARNGWLGPAVVPIDRAYGIQRYEARVSPLPNGYDLGEGGATLFPGFGAGYRYQIGSDASHIAIGELLLGGQPLKQRSGTVRHEGDKSPDAERPFFTNSSGRFVADGLKPGRYRIVLDGRERGAFTIARDQEGMTDVGTIKLDD